MGRVWVYDPYIKAPRTQEVRGSSAQTLRVSGAILPDELEFFGFTQVGPEPDTRNDDGGDRDEDVNQGAVIPGFTQLLHGCRIHRATRVKWRNLRCFWDATESSDQMGLRLGMHLDQMHEKSDLVNVVFSIGGTCTRVPT